MLLDKLRKVSKLMMYSFLMRNQRKKTCRAKHSKQIEVSDSLPSSLDLPSFPSLLLPFSLNSEALSDLGGYENVIIELDGLS